MGLNPHEPQDQDRGSYPKDENEILLASLSWENILWLWISQNGAKKKRRL
jgi:hypothetical protein